MNKNKISKIIVLIITFVLITCMTTSVFAEEPVDLTGSLTGGNTSTGGNTPTDGEEETPGDTSTDGNEETPGETLTDGNEETPKDTSTEKPGTISKYDESNKELAYAGPEDTALMISAFIIFGIIAIYAFMKMSDYSNI